MYEEGLYSTVPLKDSRSPVVSTLLVLQLLFLLLSLTLSLLQLRLQLRQHCTAVVVVIRDVPRSSVALHHLIPVTGTELRLLLYGVHGRFQRET